MGGIWVAKRGGGASVAQGDSVHIGGRVLSWLRWRVGIINWSESFWQTFIWLGHRWCRWLSCSRCGCLLIMPLLLLLLAMLFLLLLLFVCAFFRSFGCNSNFSYRLGDFPAINLVKCRDSTNFFFWGLKCKQVREEKGRDRAREGKENKEKGEEWSDRKQNCGSDLWCNVMCSTALSRDLNNNSLWMALLHSSHWWMGSLVKVKANSSMQSNLHGQLAQTAHRLWNSRPH